MSEKPGIVIIEDHPVMAEGLAASLEKSGRWRVTGKASTLSEARKLLSASLPDILLLDIQLKDGCSLELIPWLNQQNPQTKLPALVVYSAFDDYARVTAALGLGVNAYVCKHRNEEELEAILQKVLNGGRYIDEETQGKLETVSGFLSHLTKREAEILNLVKEGLSNSQIAARLNIKQRTVENILSCVYDKTGIRSRLKLQQM